MITNMPLQNHVVSLELAQKMKELGFPQETEFRWYKWPDKTMAVTMVVASYAEDWCTGRPPKEICAAYTPSDLGEWLRAFVVQNKIQYWLNISKLSPYGWEIRYHYFEKLLDDNSTGVIVERDFTNALAKMLIWLAENGHLDPKTLN